MSIGSHQRTVGASQVHLTPRRILDPLGPFFFDPCASSPRPWDIGTDINWTEADDGLSRKWPQGKRGWLNPPFHRYQIAAWLRLMAGHGRGIVLVHARTETDWFRIVRASASALFWIAGRVVFLQPNGEPQIVSNPKSKHYGKIANSGAPVVLASFGPEDCDLLASLPPPHEGAELSKGLFGDFDPLQFQRFMLVFALQHPQHAEDVTWRSIVVDFLNAQSGPVAVADLYRALRDHPRTKTNPNWQAKLRQTLQRGAGRSIARDQWVAA